MLEQPDLAQAEGGEDLGARAVVAQVLGGGRLVGVEQGLLQERNVRAKTTTLWSVAGYLAFTLIISILLAISGRRETRRLSRPCSQSVSAMQSPR